MQSKTYRMSLSAKLTIAYSVLIILATGLLSLALFWQFRQSQRDLFRERLRDLVSLGARQVNGDQFAAIRTRADENGPAYQAVLQQMRAIQAESSIIRYVGGMRAQPDGTITFVIDTDPDPATHVHVEQVYDDPGLVLEKVAATIRQTEVEEEFYTDIFGTFLSGYAPLYTSSGELAGIFYIDVDASTILAAETQTARTAGIVFLIAIPLTLSIGWWTARQLTAPIAALESGARRVAAGQLDQPVPVQSNDELGALARVFNLMTEQLRNLIGGLEQRVNDRTADLKRRSDYLAASAEVARAASSILEGEQLAQEAVELIRERFDLYYVGLFLVDEKNEWAILRAGTGQAMLARGYKLAVDVNSMIGWSIVNAQARIALQAETDAVRRITAELPETRSEAALPLRSRGKVLGALTVQSAQPDAFDQDTLTVLQTMADQIAIALENARLLAASQTAVETIRRASGELSLEGWRQLIRAQTMPGVRSVESGVSVVPDLGTEDAWPAEAQRALHTGQMVQAASPGDPAPLAVPVQVRGNVIGVIDTFKPAGSQWTPEELTLAETLAEQLGIALESARLYQDTQRRAARERTIGEVTSRMRESLDMETVLKTAADEVRRAFGLEDLMISLTLAEALDADTQEN